MAQISAPQLLTNWGWGAKQTLEHPKEAVPASPWLCDVGARWFHCQRSHRLGPALRVQKMTAEMIQHHWIAAWGSPWQEQWAQLAPSVPAFQGHLPTRQWQPFHFNNYHKIKCSFCKISLFFVRTVNFRAALLVTCWIWASIFATISPLQCNKPAALVAQSPWWLYSISHVSAVHISSTSWMVPQQRNLEKIAATRGPM